jgi:hypothetical protein
VTTRWVVLKTPWWQCIAAAVPFLMDQGDRFSLVDPVEYLGPAPFERDVVIGPHRAPMLARVFEQFADRVTLYETENLLGSEAWRAKSADLRRRAPSVPWLNYSAANAKVFGDTPRPLRRLLSGPCKPPRPQATGGPDVLFVGSMNDRRARVLYQLTAAGYHVHAPAQPTFGSDLAYLEGASRLVLNMHYYTPGIFESFRVVPAIHRGARVLSETSEAGEGADWCECVPYDRLVARAAEILESDP